jgi:hypothetical protein
MASGRSRRPLLTTGAHQAIEYVLVALFIYAALHSPDRSALVLVGAAAAVGLSAASGPGRIGFRRRLGARLHRVADSVLAAALTFAAAIAVDGEPLARVSLLVGALVLVRNAVSLTFAPASSMPSVQPSINRAARAAGILSRNLRAKRHGRDKPL